LVHVSPKKPTLVRAIIANRRFTKYHDPVLLFATLALVITLAVSMTGCGGTSLASKSGLQANSSFPAADAPAATTTTANAPDVSLLSFGNAGYGGDDTNVFQTALNNTAANHEALRIPAGSYNISPISFPDNSQVVLDSGVTVNANPGYGWLDKMLNITSQNVTITGAGASSVIFQMRKSEYVAEHSSDNSEYRHCLDIEGALNVTISGISCNQSGGDGLYIGGGAQGPSQNITINNSVFDSNFRQGFSLISGVHIFISNCHFTNTSGTLPDAGVDIEPNNAANTIADVHIDNSFASSNDGPGLLVSLWKLDGSSPKVDVTVTNYHSSSNQLSGYEFIGNDVSPNAQGTVLIQNSSSENDGSFGVIGHGYESTGVTAIFKNLTVTNPHQNGPDPTYGDSAAVGCIRGGGGINPIGNMQFQNISISADNGKIDRYFNFQDWSNVGVQKMIFNPGSLSGASQVPPDGLLQSAGFNNVDQ
jgi:hypothetical protein